MKPMLRGIAVAVAAVGVVACVQQAWRVTYAGPDNYSMGSAVLVEDSGKAYMSGYIDQQSVFLAAYNASGKKLWDRKIEGDGLTRMSMGRTLEQDEQGNLYMLQWDNTYRSTLYKFDVDGNLISSVVLQDSDHLGHMQLIDGVLYLSSGWASRVNAYGLDGQLLWFHAPEPASLPGDGDLPDYPGDEHVGTASSSSSNGYAALFGGAQLVNANGQLYFNHGDEVVALDDSGSVINSVSAAALGVDTIEMIMENGSGLMLLGTVAGATLSIAVDAALLEMSRAELSLQSNGGIVGSSKGGVLCAGLNDSGAFRMFQLSATGEPIWSQSIARDGQSWEFVETLSDGNACYLTVQVLQQGDKLLLRTERFDNAGIVTDVFNLQDFGISGVTVQGKSVYHVGITGEYDSSVTFATLDKKTLK